MLSPNDCIEVLVDNTSFYKVLEVEPIQADFIQKYTFTLSGLEHKIVVGDDAIEGVTSDKILSLKGHEVYLWTVINSSKVVIGHVITPVETSLFNTAEKSNQTQNGSNQHSLDYTPNHWWDS